MKVRTSIYMHNQTKEKLNNASEATGLSKNEIIRLLLLRFVKVSDNHVKFFSSVSYQKRRSKSEWSRCNIVLWGGMYEYCLDLRKLCKMSLSLIIAYAAHNFLDDLLEEWAVEQNRENVENTEYHCYVASVRIINDIKCWRMLWGVLPAGSSFYDECQH